MPKQNIGIRGQAMLVSVLSLGGAVLAVTTIAGLLMIYQIRQSTNIADSARAIFAADAGLEWALFESIKVSSEQPQLPQPSFLNGATVAVSCYDEFFTPLPSCEKPDPDLPSPVRVIRSVGRSGTSFRAFSLGL